MRHLNQIFKKLNLSKENGLFITIGDDWNGLFSNRVERLLNNVIKPDAFFSIDNKPFILFFESPENKKEKLKEIWNFNESPIVIITEGDSLEIYNGFEFITEDDSLRLFGKTDILNDFSYFELVTGKTWEKYQKDFSYNNRIDYHLLNNIKAVRDLLIAGGLSIELTNSLLGKVIFVRYLIDREVKLDFEKEGRSRKWTNSEFCNLLSEKKNVKAFFNYLNKKFNGDLFPISDNDIDSISTSSLSIIIKLLSGDEVASGQISLFNLYDFSIIPVEFISNVYELFIGQDQQENQGAYYTPLFLVDYILSETVEKKFRTQPRSYDCKVLDPSCGSGIFLVETLRKIIEQFQLNNPEYLNNPDQYKKQLKQLASDNIFGIDKDQSAVNVAMFSIYLTLLDYQEPSDIESFKFPLLYNRNFFSEDFFNTEADFNTRLGKISFEFILGNPPWKRGKGEKKPLYDQYINKRKKLEKGKYSNEIEISNSEIAQAFILRVSDFSKEKTKIGFIATSKVLYNLNAHGFRKYLLDQFIINKVFELAPVRREVFDKSNDKATTPAVVVFYQFAHGKNTDESIIEHITLKPSRFFSLFKVFTIHRGDYKKVIQSKLKDYDYLWKILLYGNYPDFDFINRLKSNYPKISDVVYHGDDYIIKQGIKRKDGNKKIDVSSLVGCSFIDLNKKQLDQFYISSNLKKWENHSVGYVYREKGVVAEEMFSPPVLLVKETVKTNLESVAVISDSKVVFTDKITAIKRRNNTDDSNYYNIAALLSSKLFSYFIAQTGSTTGVMIEQQIHDVEKFGFPFVENKKIKPLIKSLESLCKENVLLRDDNKIEVYKNELDQIIEDSFGLSEIEKITLEYTINYVIPVMMRLKGYKKAFSTLRKESQDLKDYIELFLNRFNSSFKKNNQKIISEVHLTNQLVGLFFKLVPVGEQIGSINFIKTDNDKILKALLNLGNEKITNRLFIQKDIRGFEKDGFYIVKPNEKRLWHKAIAHLDLNEFTDAILTAGKKHTFNVR
ncbi:Eco57I restriction-modification methylase domain-containing protein [Zhouia amylolytica]|uniref:Eco57I restriction-modification methylase domain-containing protein n=1 Tax=Zhouia amylolytica TaxID=376730 RepID=UPI0020CF98DC|nr:N-6 DNA methylase [Zhouia amylolytica]MCQ0110301.1 N-6 DNA methylase [Zhouia amylolytica]